MENRSNKYIYWKIFLSAFAGVFIAKFIMRILWDTAFVKMFLPVDGMTRKVIIQLTVQCFLAAMFFMYLRSKKRNE